MSALLPLLVGLPLAGALLVIFAPLPVRALRGAAMAVSLAAAAISAQVFVGFSTADPGFQFHWSVPWFALPGLSGPLQLALAVDGLSILLVLLSAVLVPVVLSVSAGHITERVREYLFWVLLMECGMLGVFTAQDLFLFYVFWELSLIPLYFIVGIWGGENRIYATLKFVLYTVAGSLVMLVGLIQLALDTGTTSIPELLRARLDPDLQQFAFLCFGLAFLIKVPAVPFHTWLPDAHVQAPTGGSVILAGVMLKMGTYGLMRFGVQMFPAAAVRWAPVLMAVGVAGILYGSLLAWAQRDFKKLVAYSSVAHLGFVVLGTFAFTPEALQGAVLQGVNHGISTGALFLLVGVIYDRRHVREFDQFGGLARSFPGFAFCLMLATLASVGLPGTNGFVGEFLILLGTFQARPWPAVLAALGVVLGAVYMLGMCREVLFGPITRDANRSLPPMRPREWFALAPLCAAMLWIGFHPAPMLDRTRLACEDLARRVAPYLPQQGASAPQVPSPER